MFVYVPRTDGDFELRSGRVVYRARPGDAPIESYSSTQAAQAHIMSAAEFDRRFEPHLHAWALFGATVLLIVGAPLAAWRSIGSRYAAAAA